jgi:hypothetical protein
MQVTERGIPAVFNWIGGRLIGKGLAEALQRKWRQNTRQDNLSLGDKYQLENRLTQRVNASIEYRTQNQSEVQKDDMARWKDT